MKLKRTLSLLICIVMLFGVFSLSAFSEDVQETALLGLDSVASGEENTADSDAVISVPSDCTLFVGEKGSKHFIKFSEILPVKSTEENGKTEYYFELEDDKTYNYRITSENNITYAGTFLKTPDFSLDITEEMLSENGRDKKSVDRSVDSNNGYNTADIYLNINPEGHLTLSEGESFQIVALRNWQAANNLIDNYFIEPDFNYMIIDSEGAESDSVVTVDENGLLTVRGEGEAIVLVSYDAINLDFEDGKQFYGAVWPENTGVFVVSVGAEDSSIEIITINEGLNQEASKLAGDLLDAEHDVIYFTGESAEYIYTPHTDGVSVFVNNPEISDKVSYRGFSEVSKNSDNSFSIPLKEGRNIVKVVGEEAVDYQVITAKKVEITINNGEPVCPGDTLNIVFDKVYHPANKLAGVYNMSAALIYQNVPGYEGKIAGSLPAQYNFASSSAAQSVSNILAEKDYWGSVSYEKEENLTVPADYAYDTYVLSGGVIAATGFGDPYGSHRAITLEDGKAPNFTTDARFAFLGKLPDIVIPIEVTSAGLDFIILDTDNVKTDYIEGEVFDTSGLTVTASYEDGKTQTATNYSVSPEVLTKDTEKVTIEYRGKTAEIEVNVKEAEISGIEIAALPKKTSYKAGEVFDPTGMKVFAVYENGSRSEIFDYTYEPKRELKSTDSEITVIYKTKTHEFSKEIPISVSGGSDSGSASRQIKVYFTLYGDEKHGEPESDKDTHTMSDGNLELWLSKTSVSVDKKSVVIDAVQKALSLEGIPYKVSGSGYISEVKGLGELDNGSSSGWMYTLNGKYPDYGMDEQELKDGDKIVLHYTDDYSREESAPDSDDDDDDGKGGTGSNGSSSRPSGTIIINNDNKDDTKKENEAENIFNENTFADVKKDDWFFEAVKYVYENGLMEGTKEGFEPNESMTRAMLITVLYRMQDIENEEPYKNVFADVAQGAWYEQAVAWAVEKGIVKGVSETRFAPNDNITREQAALILFRYAENTGINTEKRGDLSKFSDSSLVSGWAFDGLSWAKAEGIIVGADGKVYPQGFATRAETAQILKRFLETD